MAGDWDGQRQLMRRVAAKVAEMERETAREPAAVYQVWARYAYHRVGSGGWTMAEMLAGLDEARAVAGRLTCEDGVADVKVVAAREV